MPDYSGLGGSNSARDWTQNKIAGAEAAAQPGETLFMQSYDEKDKWLQDEFKPQKLDADTIPHPKTGYAVKVGEERRLASPAADAPKNTDGLSETPAMLNVRNYGQGWVNGVDMRHNRGMGDPPVTHQEPVQHVYRAMHIDEYKQAAQRGVIKSDERGNISPGWEGTNAGIDPDTAYSYLPRNATGVIAKIKVKPEHKWFASNADGYLRTREPIPFSDIEHVSPPITSREEISEGRRYPSTNMYLGQRIPGAPNHHNPPQTTARTSFVRKTAEDVLPSNANEISQHLQNKFPGTQVTLTDSVSGHMVLHNLQVPKENRRSGIGTQIMSELVGHADRLGKPMALSPDTSYGSSRSGLDRFYKGFGFVPNKGRNKDFTTMNSMIRLPQQTKTSFFVRKAAPKLKNLGEPLEGYDQSHQAPHPDYSFSFTPHDPNTANPSHVPVDVVNAYHKDNPNWPVGVLKLQHKDNGDNSPRGLINWVAVDQDHKGKGLGSAMLQHAVQNGQTPIHDDWSTDSVSESGAEFIDRNRAYPMVKKQYALGKKAFFVRQSENEEWKSLHTAPGRDEEGTTSPAHDVEGVMPDYYAKPHWYGSGGNSGDPSADTAHDQSYNALRRAKGNPDARVKIYRALPAEHAGKGINPGDWVSLSSEYARQHGRQDDPKHDWPVIQSWARADDLHTEGDPNEFGYNGTESLPSNIHYKGGFHQEVSQNAGGAIAPVKRRPASPIKGFSFVPDSGSYQDIMAGRGSVSAYDPQGAYAGHMKYENHQPTETHIEPQHEHLTPHLEKRMRSYLPKPPKTSATSEDSKGLISLYHGTHEQGLAHIMQNGLEAPSGVNSAGWPMLTDSFDQAARYSQGKVIEYQFKPEHLDYRHPNGLLWPAQEHNVYGINAKAYAPKVNIPSSMITKVHDVGQFKTSATQMMNPADLWGHTRDLSLPHQQTKVRSLADSITQHGYDPQMADLPIHVVLDHPSGKPVISDGNNRLKAMEMAGYNEPIQVKTGAWMSPEDRQRQQLDQLWHPDELARRGAISPFHPKSPRFMNDPLWEEGHSEMVPGLPHELGPGTPSQLHPDTPLISSQGAESTDLNKVNAIRASGGPDNYSGVHIMKHEDGSHVVIDGHHRLLADRLEGKTSPVVMHTPDELKPEVFKQYYSQPGTLTPGKTNLDVYTQHYNKTSFFVRQANPKYQYKFDPGGPIGHPDNNAWSNHQVYAYDGDKEIGYAIIGHQNRPDDGASMIGDIGVHPSYQRQGVASGMLEHAIANGVHPRHETDPDLVSSEGRKFINGTPKYAFFVRQGRQFDNSNGSLTFQYKPAEPGTTHRVDAYHNGEHAGYMELNDGGPKGGVPHGLIDMVSVKPKFRGKGIAREIGKHFENEVGITPVHSDIMTGNGIGFAQQTPEWPRWNGYGKGITPGVKPKQPDEAEQMSLFAKKAFFVRKAVRWEDHAAQTGDKLELRHSPSPGTHKSGNEYPAQVNAYVNGEYAGGLEYQPKGDGKFAPGEISDMAVYQKGKGIGRAMIEHAIAQSGSPVYHSPERTAEGDAFAAATPEFNMPEGYHEQYKAHYNSDNWQQPFQYQPVNKIAQTV